MSPSPIAPEPLPTADQARWFAEEVHPHAAQLRAYLRSSFPSVRDADDVVQESFLRVWRARAAQPIRSAKAFLFQVARHLALDSVARRKCSPVDSVGNLADLPVIEEKADVIAAIAARERVSAVATALVALPPRCREVVMLRKLKGLSRGDVAAQLGISEKTVDEQLARGVRRLQQHLRSRGTDLHFEA